ncbi:sigma-70 family RNA polymerase sigma factor [Pseudoneobacillus rhizosphaerae]|uniref:RNA polymerase sigma-H factor n=1 Tax=Pseudoneobacillus rhizosphaerae TaxID=2880968 RepID=A0A9C7LCH3_9BACI|nr:sigma-70 family RNA polymerase sigma factor [Pseudoneobacillus rhizosphaerae]CAG9610592.1 RNA polymerase sigma-H factor [Pseudoneobacillus rhizosphaerae]
MSDELLIQKVLRQNEHAFRLLVERYRNDVFRTIFAILRDQKEAEDATQEVFIKIYTSLPNYENQGFKTWITRIAVNHSIDVKRKLTRRSEEVVENIEQKELFTPPDHVEHEVIIREKKQKVHDKLDELPENYRDVIYGYYIAEKSYQQMAIEQNVQVKTIEMKLYRARHWMKKHWKEDDFS